VGSVSLEAGLTSRGPDLRGECSRGPPYAGGSPVFNRAIRPVKHPLLLTTRLTDEDDIVTQDGTGTERRPGERAPDVAELALPSGLRIAICVTGSLYATQVPGYVMRLWWRHLLAAGLGPTGEVA